MSFINKSVNFSQTVLLKTSLLAPLLEAYNRHVATAEQGPLNPIHNILIPNNNKKFYMFVTTKQMLEQTREDFNILYFFPSDVSVSAVEGVTTERHGVSDFCMEIDRKFKDSWLLEGYMYVSDNKYDFLLTDVLCKNNTVISFDYPLRYALLCELIANTPGSLKHLNDHLSINMHPVFPAVNENLIKVFVNNFVHKAEFKCVESVNKGKVQCMKVADHQSGIVQKVAKHGGFSDVYNVYNKETGVHEGILYIKGFKDSQLMKKLMLGKKEVQLDCEFDTCFAKWRPLLDSHAR